MIWEKQAGESAAAYLWFCRYRDYPKDQGEPRSAEKVRQKYGKKPSYRRQLERWASKYDWIKRVEAYDAYLDEKKRNIRENEILAAEREHIQFADSIMLKLKQRLNCLDPESLTNREFIALINLTVRIKREALGIAAKYEVTQKTDLDDYLAEELLERSRELLKRD